MPVIEVKSYAEWTQLRASSNKTLVVYFTAPWCGPCNVIRLVFDALSVAYSNDASLSFVKVDVDELPDVAEDQDIRAMPTFKVLRSDVELGVLVGAYKDKLSVFLDGIIGKPAPAE